MVLQPAKSVTLNSIYGKCQQSHPITQLIAPRIPVKITVPKNFGRRLKINTTLKSLNSYYL